MYVKERNYFYASVLFVLFNFCILPVVGIFIIFHIMFLFLKNRSHLGYLQFTSDTFLYISIYISSSETDDVYIYISAESIFFFKRSAFYSKYYE